MTKQYRAWIEEQGCRFVVIEEGILFPGRKNRVHASWASRDGARRYCKRNNRIVEKGNCPLPEVSEEERAAYQAHARNAR